jgi:Flp pilus assembly protein TadG
LRAGGGVWDWGWTAVAARRLWKDQDGASVVEFALAAPVFLAFLIAIIELGALGMMSANFNGAVDTVSRRIRTGQADKPQTANDFRNLICARMVDRAANCQTRMRVTVQPVTGNFGDARAVLLGQDRGNLTGQQAYATGAGDDVMLVTATYSWPMPLPLVSGPYIRDGVWNVLIVSRLAFKNEPWE